MKSLPKATLVHRFGVDMNGIGCKGNKKNDYSSSFCIFFHHRAKMKEKLMLLLYDILEFLPAIGQPIVVLGTLRYKQRTSIGVHTLEGIRLGKRRNF